LENDRKADPDGRASGSSFTLLQATMDRLQGSARSTIDGPPSVAADEVWGEPSLTTKGQTRGNHGWHGKKTCCSMVATSSTRQKCNPVTALGTDCAAFASVCVGGNSSTAERAPECTLKRRRLLFALFQNLNTLPSAYWVDNALTCEQCCIPRVFHASVRLSGDQ